MLAARYSILQRAPSLQSVRSLMREQYLDIVDFGGGLVLIVEVLQ